MSDKSTQAERRDLAGSTGSMTYHPAPQSNKRWRAVVASEARQERAARATVVVGETPAVSIQAAFGSPWAGDLVGLEPPLGFSVECDGADRRGHEIQASLAAGSPVPVATAGAEEGAPLASSAPDPSSAHAQLAQLLPKIAIKRKPRKW